MKFYKSYWDLQKRYLLQRYLLEGYKIYELKDELSVSPQTLYDELRRGCTEEEYKKSRFVKYDPIRALFREAGRAFAPEGVKALYEHYEEYHNYADVSEEA